MKIIILSFVFIFSLLGISNKIADCSDAYDSADDAYSYSKKAFDNDDYEDMKAYLKKAMSSFEDAMSNADDCNCDDAESSADDGYTFAKKGYNSTDYNDIKDYAKKAKNAAEETMSNAEDCDD